jgi:1-acyl-sn-glycerol-3-phosphate acyltransferase
MPAAGSPGQVGPARIAARVLGGLVVLIAATAASPLLAIAGPELRFRAIRAAARGLLRALGVAHDVHGGLPRRSALIAANHISWLDILVLMAHTPIRLVAKREVRDWPVIGRLATAAGTLFIERSSPRGLPITVGEVERALRSGSVVATFPEGTTWCGGDAGPFRPALFQAALAAGVRVVPVTVRFCLSDGTPTTAAAFVGEDSLVASIRRVVSVRGLRVSLRTHAELQPLGADTRRTLARHAHGAVMSRPA